MKTHEHFNKNPSSLQRISQYMTKKVVGTQELVLGLLAVGMLANLFLTRH